MYLNDSLVDTFFRVLVPRYSDASPSISSVPSSSSAASDATLAPTSSSHSLSYYIFATHVPGIRTVSLQRYRIGCVTIYCATIFCLIRTYAFIYLNPSSCITVSIVGYYQLLSIKRRGCLPVIRWATLCWNPPRARPMMGSSPTSCTQKEVPPAPPPWRTYPTTLGFPPPFSRLSTDFPSYSLPYIGSTQTPSNHHSKLSWSAWVLPFRYQVQWSSVGLEGPRRALTHVLCLQSKPFPIYPLDALGGGGVSSIQDLTRYQHSTAGA